MSLHEELSLQLAKWLFDSEATAYRWIKAIDEMTEGYDQDPKEILKTFAAQHDEMVLVRNVPFSSLCEHHLFPFSGHATVGYLPAGRVVGLSKIPRLVQAYATRLQLQERMTAQIATAFHSIIEPRGTGVVLTASHTCMRCRGVKSEGDMVTSSLLGVLRTDARARAEFLRFVT